MTDKPDEDAFEPNRVRISGETEADMVARPRARPRRLRPTRRVETVQLTLPLADGSR